MTQFLGKTIGSTIVVATFLLIALATSYDKDFPSFLEGSVTNISDSCSVTGFRFVFQSSRNVNDTIPANFYPDLVPPGDTAEILVDSLTYRKLLYVCSCPGDTAYFREIDLLPVASGSNRFEPMEVGCD